MTTTLTEAADDDLRQFTGSETFYQHGLTPLRYTEGVHYLAETGGAYWLIDLIASYQHDRRVRANPRLQEFQLWELTVADQKGVATLREDSGCDPVIEQRIAYTNFPLLNVKLYVENRTLFLPSER
jgi:hypothetical protein